MNCEQAEQLMADALGGELSENDRGPFKAHLVGCQRCRADDESSRAALAAMRSLPSPPQLGLRREGDRLVLSPRVPGAGASARRWASTAARYAAVILLAFMLGYVARAARSPQTPHQRVAQPETDAPAQQRVDPAASRDTVRLALIGEIACDRSRPEFAKCMSVLFGAESN